MAVQTHIAMECYATHWRLWRESRNCSFKMLAPYGALLSYFSINIHIFIYFTYCLASCFSLIFRGDDQSSIAFINRRATI